jgi:hypothetical protein
VIRALRAPLAFLALAEWAGKEAMAASTGTSELMEILDRLDHRVRLDCCVCSGTPFPFLFYAFMKEDFDLFPFACILSHAALPMTSFMHEHPSIRSFSHFPGEKGLLGLKGNAGIDQGTGPDGDTGPRGSPGLDGLTGTNGLDGIPGDKGFAGINGVNGTNGAPGATGPRGGAGPVGEKGVTSPPHASHALPNSSAPHLVAVLRSPFLSSLFPGAPGLDGANGRDGLNGAPGIKGLHGEAGLLGLFHIDLLLLLHGRDFYSQATMVFRVSLVFPLRQMVRPE